MRTAEQTRSKYSFLLDGMLGSLARWLRIAGYDTLYYIDMEDNELLEEARKKNRVLLTRDKLLTQRANKSRINAFLVTSEDTSKQLSQVKESLGLDPVPSLSRCPVCNHVLSKKTREEVQGKVPETSLDAFEDFLGCAGCEKVYWKGSHWENIRKTLENS